MNHTYLYLLALVPSVLLLFYVGALFVDQVSEKAHKRLIDGVSILSIVAAAYCLIQNQFSGIVRQFDLLIYQDLGLSVRVDGLSAVMLLMVTLLAYVVLRFSRNYMEGDPRKRVFMKRIALTIASVEMLVLSGNIMHLFIFWVLTSVCLHYLLAFYNRPKAVLAAKKKFIVARIGDLSLLSALIVLYVNYGAADLSILFDKVTTMSGNGIALPIATVLIVIAALLKSAQFPTHGWLVEVIEAPTPVSALLHAGLLNAGPFLIVRLSPVLYDSVPASLLLIAFGGFTALFASSVFLTQPSVKVSLGYSSVAHMGFMLLICGFGVYSAAILHLVAHSFYKAHAFLSSGSAIDMIRARRVKLPERQGNIFKVTLSIISAAVIYLGMCYLWGINPENNFTLMATGAIIVMGISLIIAPTLDAKGNKSAILKSIGMAFGVTLSFFTLEHVAHIILHRQIPSDFIIPLITKIAVVTVLLLFAVTVFLQIISPSMKRSKWANAFGIHLRNGFYANAIFDRLVGGLSVDGRKMSNFNNTEFQSVKSFSKAEEANSTQLFQASKSEA